MIAAPAPMGRRRAARWSTLLVVLALGLASPASRALDLTVQPDGAATTTAVRLRVVAAEDVAPLQPSGSVPITLGIGPGPVATSITIGPGVLPAQNVTLDAVGPNDEVTVTLTNVAVTLTSPLLTATPTGANRSVVPADAIQFEATAGMLAPSGEACLIESFPPRNLASNPEVVENDAATGAVATIDTVPIATGLAVTITIPVQAAEPALLDCPPVWLLFEGDLVLEANLPACSDGIDDDGDGLVDLADPGCNGFANRTFEDPECQNGLDDDGDGHIDFDGGASVNGGTPLGTADPQCSNGGDNTERRTRACGLGAEIALLAPVWVFARRMTRRRLAARD